MNVFHKVTLQSLKKNRTRTIVTIIGIMLSAAMICAVTTFVSSMHNYALEYAIYNQGDWHGAVYDATLEDYQKIKNDDQVSQAAYGQLMGYAKIHSENTYKPYMYVIGGQPGSFFETMPVHLISGRLPENGSELLIPAHLAENGGLDYRVGDRVTLELGQRLLDGFPLNQRNPCYVYDWTIQDEILNDEQIQLQQTRLFTVVGVYERPGFEEHTAPGYTALTVADATVSDTTLFDVYFKMKTPGQVYDYLKTFELESTWNSEVLLYSGISRYSSFSAMLANLAVIVIVLIMFGSVSLIYNAFAISVSERTRQFGLLSSVGATKKQLKKMVLFEALAVSAVGIPLGIGVGIGGIGVTLLLIGNRFSSVMDGFEQPMRICVSWQAVVIAAIVALVTVLISAWIPSIRATRVSAVEAIRQNVDIKNLKPAKTSRLTYRLFGLPGVLASKHYSRSRKKYRTTVISLFMSIVLFVSASAFTNYLMEAALGSRGTEQYDLWYGADVEHMEGKTPDQLLELLGREANVTAIAYANASFFEGSLDRQKATDEFLKGQDLRQSVPINGYIYFVNDEAFMQLLDQYKLSRQRFMDSKAPLAVAVDNNALFDTAREKYVEMDVLRGDEAVITAYAQKEYPGYSPFGEREDGDGNRFLQYINNEDSTDILTIPYEEATVSYTLQAGKTITQTPFYLTASTPVHVKLIYPISMLTVVLPEQAQKDFCYYRFAMQSDNHGATYENLKQSLRENGLNVNSLTNYAETVEMSRNLLTIVQVFAYGFTVLISLIAAANVFNTISTNIGLRRREFAMLKSVGMCQRDFNKMMNYECLLYGSRSLLLGLPVAAGVSWLIYRAISDGYETAFRLPWGALAIAVVSVFLMVSVTMLYAMGKIKKDNPIDALKNENL